MSNLIKKQDIKDFESEEEKWLSDEGAFDAYWDKKLEDESFFFDWLRARFEHTANRFSELSRLQGTFYSKLIDLLQEAAMTGFFFGELRWNRDISKMLSDVLEDVPPEN